MNKNQMLIVSGIIVLGLLLAWVYQGMVSAPAPSSPTRAGPTVMRQSSPPLQKTDKDGNTWALELAGGQSFTSPIPADPNGTKAGPAVIVKTDVRRQSDREVSIGLVLTGPAGEMFRPGVMKNGSRQSAPAFRIVNEAGQVILDDSFQYG